MRVLAPVLWLLSACSGTVDDDMERALAVTNAAIAWGLLASEGAAWADETDPRWPRTLTASGAFLRHAPAGNCPTIDREPETGYPFTLDAEYAGCVSGSRLVPTTLGGVLRIAGDEQLVHFEFGELPIGSVRIAEGSLTGARELGVEVYEMVGALYLPKTTLLEAEAAELHLTVDHRVDAQVSFRGHALIGEGPSTVRVDLDQVAIELDDIPGECPLPYSGTTRIRSDPEVVVDLSGSDASGKVVVTRRSRTSTPTRLCAFASDVL